MSDNFRRLRAEDPEPPRYTLAEVREGLLSDEVIISVAKRTHPLLAQYKESEVEMIFDFKRADLLAALDRFEQEEGKR